MSESASATAALGTLADVESPTAGVPRLPSGQDVKRLFLQKYGALERHGWALRRRFRFNYFLPAEVYETAVSGLVCDGCSWIDVGGGRDIFPNNSALARQLVSRCSTVVAVDPSENV